MVTTNGMSGFGGGMGMFGGGAGANFMGANPYAGMNPYAGNWMSALTPPTQSPDPTNAMSQLGQGTPQAPTGAWAINPASAPPWAQAAMQSPGGMQGYLQNQRSQQLAAQPDRMQAMQAAMGQIGQMPQGMPQGFGNILSGGAGFGPQQPQGRPQQAKQMAQFRPQQRQPQRRRQTSLASGPNNGNVLF